MKRNIGAMPFACSQGINSARVLEKNGLLCEGTMRHRVRNMLVGDSQCMAAIERPSSAKRGHPGWPFFSNFFNRNLMTKRKYFYRISWFFMWSLCMAVAIPGFATEPLHDQYILGELNGNIFPSKCCWMELPPSKRLEDMRMSERCSAIGGPVGTFKLEGGRLWLTRLYKCSGEVDFHEIYPDLKNPALADWLSGTFRARLGFLCTDKSAQPVYSVEQILTVEKGNVESISETRNDRSACATDNRSGVRSGG